VRFGKLRDATRKALWRELLYCMARALPAHPTLWFTKAMYIIAFYVCLRYTKSGMSAEIVTFWSIQHNLASDQ
jgi:hypothetical protein